VYPCWNFVWKLLLQQQFETSAFKPTVLHNFLNSKNFDCSLSNVAPSSHKYEMRVSLHQMHSASFQSSSLFSCFFVIAIITHCMSASLCVANVTFAGRECQLGNFMDHGCFLWITELRTDFRLKLMNDCQDRALSADIHPSFVTIFSRAAAASSINN